MVFDSAATTLVRGDRNDASDVFAHDLATGKTRRVSVSSAGEEGDEQSGDPAVSADGRYVVFTSWAPTSSAVTATVTRTSSCTTSPRAEPDASV